jgi:hypothetical protein
MQLTTDGDVFVTAGGMSCTLTSSLAVTSPYIEFAEVNSFEVSNQSHSMLLNVEEAILEPLGTGWAIGSDTTRFANGYINNLFLYNSYTNSGNWERGAVTWVGNVLEIFTQRAGTGSARPIIFRTNGGNRLQIGGAGTITATLAANQNFIITGLPTANPNVAGALWNDGGTLKVSAG